MSIQMIPVNLLFLAPENVRKTDVGPDDPLVASIRAKGLLQNLVVRPNVSPKGKKRGQAAGTYAVIAGGRRLQVLQLLAQEGHHPEDLPVACAVKSDGGTGDSLAENFARKAMAPLDELDAFSALIEQGEIPEDVARQFGITVLHVKQRMKLARVSPVIREAFRNETINLDALRAYSITEDRAAQEETFRAGGGNNPYYIRAALMRGAMTAGDRLAVYVGLDAYEAAGGAVYRDLFGIADTRIDDPALMRRLAAEKLQAEANALRAEGWAWVEIVDSITWEMTKVCQRLVGGGPGLSEEETAEAEALEAEAERLDPEEDAERCRSIQVRLAEIGRLSLAREWTAEQRAAAGGWIAIGYDAEIEFRMGYVKPEPAAEPDGEEPADDGEDASEGGTDGQVTRLSLAVPAKSTPQVENEAQGLSFPLIEDLSAHFTAALQAEIAERPDLAYLILLHRIVMDTISWTSRQVALDIRAHQHRMEHKGATVKGSPAAAALDARLESWSERLPDDPAALWQYLESASDYDRADILAVCVASCLHAVIGRNARASERGYDEDRYANARNLAALVGLDMAKWWRPTGGNYLGAVSKDLVIEALTEAGQVKPGERLASAKKAELVALAEDRLGPTTWLPAFLRTGSQADSALDGADTPEVLPAETQALAAE
ncbi:MAG: ParB/RepB/Spo0J family partition protein [Inquilinus sp.]|uniref:ParB/RepB/Spo0J family partition protein n=1 Tax=Inquilinus sp. TaxID=1932117 RepID=UPI003F3A8D27